MPRNSDIEIAWRQAIVIEPNGRDVSTQEGDERTFQLYNPNGGL